MSELTLDDIDMTIIAELSRNANISHTELASICGITRQTIAARIKALEKEGVIKKYRAVIDYSKLGFGAFILLFLKLDVSDQAMVNSFIKALKSDPCVIMDVSITGEWDVMLMLAFNDVRQYESYINDMRVKVGPILKDSKSHVVLNFYKKPEEYVPGVKKKR
jgi:Lrp/AsnC family leucine-responsive transcriptional regulator